jgi:hypothetical protein
MIVAASVLTYLAVQGYKDCCKISAADRWELVWASLLLLLLV